MIIPGVHPFGPVGPVWWGVCNTPLHRVRSFGPSARPGFRPGLWSTGPTARPGTWGETAYAHPTGPQGPNGTYPGRPVGPPDHSPGRNPGRRNPGAQRHTPPNGPPGPNGWTPGMIIRPVPGRPVGRMQYAPTRVRSFGPSARPVVRSFGPVGPAQGFALGYGPPGLQPGRVRAFAPYRGAR